jgi:hypothetical protein
MTENGITEMFTGENEILPQGQYVQTQQEMLSQRGHIKANNQKMILLLERLSKNRIQ